MSRRRQTERDRPYWPHSQTFTDEPTDVSQRNPTTQRETLDGTQACVTGCTQLDTHQPHCPCHTECPDHEGHCHGCAPRPARQGSLLCGTCFHWRLRTPLDELPRRHDWLGECMGGAKSQTYEPSVSGSHEAPLPIDTGMHELRVTMTLVMAAWADRVAREHVPAIAPPKAHGIAASCGYLSRRAAWISRQAWVSWPVSDERPQRWTLLGAMRELTRRAQGLAPWERTKVAVDVLCARCGNRSMVFLEGETYLRCQVRGCGYTQSFYRERALKGLEKKLGTRRQVG